MCSSPSHRAVSLPSVLPLLSQIVLLLFQLQLALVAWDRASAEAVITAVGAALQAAGGGEGEGEQQDSPAVQQLKLHFNILQVRRSPLDTPDILCGPYLTPTSSPYPTYSRNLNRPAPQIIYLIRLGQYDQLVRAEGDAVAPSPASGGGSAAAATPTAIATMEELLAAVQASGGAGSYEWLPVEAQEGVVRLLAAVVLRAPGRVKAALAQVDKGERVGCRRMSVWVVWMLGGLLRGAS
jgi:hypothetical protein